MTKFKRDLLEKMHTNDTEVKDKELKEKNELINRIKSLENCVTELHGTCRRLLGLPSNTRTYVLPYIMNLR